MENKPFWEHTYADSTVSTFSAKPTKDIQDYYHIFPTNSIVLDVGCGEGRNSMFMAKLGNTVDAFDISQSGINKAKEISNGLGIDVNFFCCDLGVFSFEKQYDIILSHGVLHLPYRNIRNEFISKMQENTKIGGYNAVLVFTNRTPATPDNAPFTHSLFNVGELPELYKGWEFILHEEDVFIDTHPGNIHHKHAFEKIIAKRIK